MDIERLRLLLFAPPEYWQLADEERAKFRCGPGRGILEILVPDEIMDCDIRPACGIHDFSYDQGKTEDDKCFADLVFRNNLVRIIEAYGGDTDKQKRRLKIAQGYYEAVSHFGGPAFWKDKNKPEEMGSVSLLPYRKSDGFV